MGSIGVAAGLAKAIFVVLVVLGFSYGELGRRTVVVFTIAGLVAWIVLPRFTLGAVIATPVLAVIDIALVFAVFKGDVKLT